MGRATAPARAGAQSRSRPSQSAGGISRDSNSRMKPRIESKALLQPECIEPDCDRGHKNQVPAVARHRARDDHERVSCEQVVAKGLLAGARNAGPQPVRVWDILRLDNADSGRVENSCRSEHMRNSVERPKSLVNRYLQNCRRRIERGVNCPYAAAVPPAAGSEGPFAAVPGRSEIDLVQAPSHQFTSAERRRQWDHI